MYVCDLGAREAGPMPERLEFGPAGDLLSLRWYLDAWHLWRAVCRDAVMTDEELGARFDARVERLQRLMAERARG